MSERAASTAVGTAFVFDEAQAEDFIANAPPVQSVVTLAPLARLPLDEKQVQPIPSDQLYTNEMHALVLQRVERARASFDRRIVEYDLAPPALDVLGWRLVQVCGVTSAFWEFLRVPKPWVIHTDGAWKSFEDKAAAHAALLRVLAASEKPFKPPSRLSGIFARVVLLCASTLCRVRGTVMLPGATRGLARLAAVLKDKEKLDVLHIGLADGTFKAVLAHAWKMIKGDFFSLRIQIPSNVDGATARSIRRFIESRHEDEVIGRGYAAFADELATHAGVSATFSSGLKLAIKRLKTRSVLTWEGVTVRSAALAHAAHGCGANVFVSAHFTVSQPDSPAATWIKDTMATAITTSRVADFAVVQSPTVAAAARRVKPSLPQIEAMPFLWGSPVQCEATEVPLFLWAGDFHTWFRHRPWTDETPDEIIASLACFAGAVLSTPARLEVRIKPSWKNKGGLDETALQRYLPASDRIAVRSSGSFLESLKFATVVVTASSTALEEAFAARVPVVLWGTRDRCRHLVGRTTPPNGADRAAVYTPPWDCDLGEFLRAVVSSHHNKPLSDTELEGLVWRDAVAGYEELAKALAQPKPQPIARVQ